MISLVLAAAPTGEAAKSGPWGLVSILVLCVACYFLFKSMSRHLRKVRETFPENPTVPPVAGPLAEPAAPSLVKRTPERRRGPGGQDADGPPA